MFNSAEIFSLNSKELFQLSAWNVGTVRLRLLRNQDMYEQRTIGERLERASVLSEERFVDSRN